MSDMTEALNCDNCETMNVCGNQGRRNFLKVVIYRIKDEIK